MYQQSYLLTQAKNGIAASELGRHVGVGSNTAWLVKHQLIQAMLEREAGRKLQGEVHVDEAYLVGSTLVASAGGARRTRRRSW